MKYLLVLAVVVVAFYIWRNNRLADRGDAAPPNPSRRPATPAIMVACRQCGTHLPQSEAVQGRDGSCYCSAEHRQLQEGSKH